MTGFPGGGTEEYGYAVQAAVKAVNDSGGINGRPLEVKICNDQANPNQDLQCAQEAVSDHAIASVGEEEFSGGSGDQVMTSNKIPVVGPDLQNEQTLVNPLVFPTYSSLYAGALAAPQVCKLLGATKIRQAATALPSLALLTSKYFPEGAQIAGLKFVGPTVTFPPTQSDFSAIAQQLTQDGTNCIVGEVTDPLPGLLIPALKQAGYTGKIVLGNAILQGGALATLKDQADGVYSVGSAYTESSSPGIAQFEKEMAAVGHSNPPISDFTINSWAAVHFLADTLKKLKTVSSGALVNQLNQTGAESIPPLAPFNMDYAKSPFGHGIRLPGASVTVSVVQNGQLKTLYGGKFVNATHLPSPLK
jgi:branched-chain amino acid transport system substrate-binding protein